MDWHAWHGQYDGDTPHARRLELVRARIRDVLAASAAASIGVISICAGDGRDILGALSGHADGARVHGRLVELDPDLAAVARQRARTAGLALEVVEEDAGWSDAYMGADPADLLLVCGVFGNISDRDVERTIRALPMLMAPDGFVIWTRHRREPDLTPAVRSWFAQSGFDEVSFELVSNSFATVGVHWLTGAALPFRHGMRLFEFIREA